MLVLPFPSSTAFIPDQDQGLKSYYVSKIEELQIKIRDKTQNFERLKAQRNELNNKVCFFPSNLMSYSIYKIRFD
jgi:hypothetical protein